MPRRTNWFQEVVEIVHLHMAGDASVEASAMLPSSSTGAMKEVDVVIRSWQAGHEVIVSVEAIASSRPADRNWVDKQLGRHADLPTSKLVLVSRNGFTRDAKAAALAQDAVAITPENLVNDDERGRLVAAVKSLWFKLVTFLPQTISVKFEDSRAPGDGWPDEPQVYADDGSHLADTLEQFAKAVYDENLAVVIEQMDLLKGVEDQERTATFRLEDLYRLVEGVERRVCLRNGNGRLYALKWILVTGESKTQVSEVPIVHGRLGEMRTRFLYGQGKIGDRDALIVASTIEDDDTGMRTIRIRPKPRHGDLPTD